jgi:hypothetical protein
MPLTLTPASRERSVYLLVYNHVSDDLQQEKHGHQHGGYGVQVAPLAKLHVRARSESTIPSQRADARREGFTATLCWSAPKDGEMNHVL